MVLCSDTSSEAAMEKLKKSLEVKSLEARALNIEIQRARLEAQMLRLQLLCQGVQDESVIPNDLRTGGSFEDPTSKFLEHRRLLEWLAEVCDLSSRKYCNVVGDLVVAGQKAVIGHAAQWTLSVPNDLCLTCPIELEGTIVGLLSKARRSTLSLQDLEGFASEWDMLAVEMNVEGEGLPGLFLLRREDGTAVVVSAWPKLPAPACVTPLCQPFDAASFFQHSTKARLDAANAVFYDHTGVVHTLSFNEGVVTWHSSTGCCERVCDLGISFCLCDELQDECFSLTGPFGRVTMSDPLPGTPQRDMVEEIVSLSLEHGVLVYHAQAASEGVLTSLQLPAVSKSEREAEHQRSVSKGDSVFIQYQGEWVAGVLKGVQGEFALVSCDADDPDIITVAPLRQVRVASYDDSGGEHGMNA